MNAAELARQARTVFAETSDSQVEALADIVAELADLVAGLGATPTETHGPTERALTVAAVRLRDWIKEQKQTGLIGCTPAMVSQVVVDAAAPLIAAEALEEAAKDWEGLVQREIPPVRGSVWLQRRADRIATRDV